MMPCRGGGEEDDNEQFGVKDPNGLMAPSVQRYSAAAGDELLLIAGGDTFVMEHDPARLCLAWIADRQGKTKHVWHFDPAIWADVPYAPRKAGW